MITSQAYSTARNLSSTKSLLYAALQVLCASFIIGIATQIRIPLYFSPVPITGQTFAIMMIGAILGSKKGALSVLCYLVERCVGIPLITTGQEGLLSIIGPTGGYLLGFVIQAYMVGYFVERQKKFGSVKTLLVLLLSSVVQMGTGCIWLSSFVGLQNVLTMGFYPFIPGEVVKAFCVTGYLKVKN